MTAKWSRDIRISSKCVSLNYLLADSLLLLSNFLDIESIPFNRQLVLSVSWKQQTYKQYTNTFSIRYYYHMHVLYSRNGLSNSTGILDLVRNPSVIDSGIAVTQRATSDVVMLNSLRFRNRPKIRIEDCI